jgi:hypothetical protein
MTPIPDVFRTPFQTAPLDIGTDAFYPTRRQAIENRLQVWYGFMRNAYRSEKGRSLETSFRCVEGTEKYMLHQ